MAVASELRSPKGALDRADLHVADLEGLVPVAALPSPQSIDPEMGGYDR